MNIKYRKLMMMALLTISITAFGTAAHAQWDIVQTQTDAAGHLVFLKEKNRRGDVRSTSRTYFRGTHVVARERIHVKKADGTVAVIIESHDAQNRVTSILNQYFNAAGVMTRGVRQFWAYRDARDQRGLQTNEQWDAANLRWRRLS